MRTDVLTNREVTAILARTYVCAWANTDDDPTCGSSFCHEPGEATVPCRVSDGEHNTQLCIFTSDRRLLMVMAGYQTPQAIATELLYADRELRPIAESATLSDDEKRAEVRKLLRACGDAPERNERADLNFVADHALDSWARFTVEKLVQGRGFGDNFFGRVGGALPRSVLGTSQADRGKLLDSYSRKKLHLDDKHRAMKDQRIDSLLLRISALKRAEQELIERGKSRVTDELKPLEKELHLRIEAFVAVGEPRQ